MLENLIVSENLSDLPFLQAIKNAQAKNLFRYTLPQVAGKKRRKLQKPLSHKDWRLPAGYRPQSLEFYWWRDKMEQEEAWVCLMKTRKELFEEVSQTIREIHSYELPAIVATPMLMANDGYFDWIVAETTK